MKGIYMVNHPLSTLLLLPVIGIIIILFINKEKPFIVRTIAAIIVGLQVWITIQLLIAFDRSTYTLQFVDHFSWINAFSIDYILGIDGINLPFVALATLILFITILISWRQSDNPKTFFTLILLFDLGIIGLFLAFDLFLFISFLGVLLFSTFFLMSLFTPETGIRPALHFGIYAIISFCFILIGTLIISSKTDPSTFNIIHLFQNPDLSKSHQTTGFFMFLIGFLFITPVVPFHAWFVNSVNKTSLPVKVLLTALFSKIGLFGILRLVLPIFPIPSQQFIMILGLIAVISILYYSICAFSYTPFGAIITYYTGFQTGIALLGISSIYALRTNGAEIAATGINGAIAQLISSGLALPLLLLLPNVLQMRNNNKSLSDKSSDQQRWIYSFIIALILLAAAGVPGFFTFFTQLLCFLGTFQVSATRILVFLSFIGIIFIAITFFRIIQNILLKNSDTDIAFSNFQSENTMLIVISLLIIIIFLGLNPNPFIGIINQSVHHLIDIVIAI